MNQNKSELSEQLSLFSRERKCQMSQCHHDFRWSERSGILYFKIRQNTSASLFVFSLLFCIVFAGFFRSGTHLLLRRDGLWVERSSGSSLMSNFVNSRCLSALEIQKQFSLALYLFQIKPAKLKIMVIESHFLKQPLSVFLKSTGA